MKSRICCAGALLLTVAWASPARAHDIDLEADLVPASTLVGRKAEAEAEFKQKRVNLPSTRQAELEAEGLKNFNGQVLEFRINGALAGSGVVRKGKLKIT